MDRNDDILRNLLNRRLSLSARRAWIEINVLSQPSKPRRVALRKESVDRNIAKPFREQFKYVVALRKESVDRNCKMRK